MLKILICCLFVIISSNTHSKNLYLENYFGSLIVYKKSQPESDANSYILKDQASTLVGIIGYVSELSIRRVPQIFNFSKLAPFFDLKPVLQEVEKETKNNPNKDAVIVIKPSNRFSDWDTQILWRLPNTKVEVFYSPEEIINRVADSLNDDYKKKIWEILEYNYSKETSMGFVNLGRRLTNFIDNFGKNTYIINPKRKREFITPPLANIEDLKEEINLLYNSLQKYRKRDEPQQFN